MLVVTGVCWADIIIAKPMNSVTEEGVRIPDINGEVLSTMLFCVNVIPMPLDSAEITSLTEFQMLQDLLRVATKDYEEIIEQTKHYSDLSENWAVGVPTGMRTDESVNNSKYWSEQSKQNLDLIKSYSDSAKDSEEKALAYKDSAKDSADSALATLGEVNERGEEIIQMSDDLRQKVDDANAHIDGKVDEADKFIQDSVDAATTHIEAAVDGVDEHITEIMAATAPEFNVDISTGHLIYTLK